MNTALLNDIFRMLAGIGMFLLGMKFLEDALRHIAGRSFKLFLRRQTGSKVKAILGGAVVTAVLQSGSVVNLMVLAFVGSGVLTLRHALAVMLGSNIGTTLDSWVVALVGFRYSIEMIAYPLLGLAGLLLAGTTKGTSWNHRAMMFFGIAALFVGLDFIKSGFSEMAGQIDFTPYRDYPIIVFMLAGVIITALIQSSYATVALVLGALHAGALTLLPATAIVLGAEVGTTVKLLIAASGGEAAKRRVAWANFLFNTITILVVGLAIRPINQLLTGPFGITDPLVGLVFFQSFVNVAGALVFLPLLNPAARFLEKRVGEKYAVCRHINNVPAASADLALEAMEKEVHRFVGLTLIFFRTSFRLPTDANSDIGESSFAHESVQVQYAFLKELHGQVHAYYLSFPGDQLTREESLRAEQVIGSLRNAMFAAKSIHDSGSDIVQLRESSNEEKFSIYVRSRQQMSDFSAEMFRLLTLPDAGRFEPIVAAYQKIQTGYGEQIDELYRPAVAGRLNETEISTLLNFNRELYSGFKAMVWSVKDLLLTEKEAEYFSELPGFIR